MNYCIPCAQNLQVQVPPLSVGSATAGTCAICRANTTVLHEVLYGHNKHRLNPAALRAKMQRGVVQQNITQH